LHIPEANATVFAGLQSRPPDIRRRCSLFVCAYLVTDKEAQRAPRRRGREIEEGMGVRSYRVRVLLSLGLLVVLLSRGHARADATPAPPPSPPPTITTGFIRVTGESVPITISDPGAPVTFNTGALLPFVQQNDRFFIALVTDEHGTRLSAFPLKASDRGSRRSENEGGMFADNPAKGLRRSAWVTADNEMFFAYRTTSCTGTLYLTRNETLPVVEVNAAAYGAVIDRFNHRATLWIPRNMPNLEFIHAREAERVLGITVAGAATTTPATTVVARKTLVVQYPPENFEDISDTQAPVVEEKKGFWTRARAQMAGLLTRKPRSTVEEAVTAAGAPPPGTSATVAVASAPTNTPTPAPPPKPRRPLGPRVLTRLERAQPILKVMLAAVILAASCWSIQQRRALRKKAVVEHAATQVVLQPESQKTAIPAATATSPTPQKADFTGSISSMSLGSLAQFLNADKETGTLHVKDKSNTDCGTILFAKGEIVDAQTQTNRGVEAVHEILRLQKGVFSFLRKEHENVEQTVEQGTISILLDAHRVIDEETSSETNT
jgi:hypothetical protein